MKKTTWLAACTTLWAVQAAAQTLPANPASASSTAARRDFSSRDFGQREFQRSCASCHGGVAKGDGPLVPYLRRSPPDLTQLAKSNQGVFPFQRLYDVIEGGKLPAHGSRDMPVWGTQYKTEDAEYHSDSILPYDPEALARSRILGLLEYLNRIQAR
jgi:mono/diheme cytochrome c family protein